MESYTRFLLIIYGLTTTILAMPRPDGFDDEGEMSVPRAPKIQGPDVVSLPYANHTEVEHLQCLIEGSPTPTVIWLKDGQELQSTVDLYNMTYDATDGRARLCFVEAAKRDQKYVTGNFTCIAANFLGRVQKTFVVEITVENMPSITSSSTVVVTSITENITTTKTSDVSDSKTKSSTVNATTSFTSASTSEVTNFVTSQSSPTPATIVNNATQAKSD